MRRCYLTLLALVASLAVVGQAAAAVPLRGEFAGDLRPLELRALSLPSGAGMVLDANTPLPLKWCGQPTGTEGRQNESDPTKAEIKVIYAHPAGTPDQFAATADMIQASAVIVDAYVAQAANGLKAPRFDMGTSCGPQYLDILDLSLSQPASYYYDGKNMPDLKKLQIEAAAALGPELGVRDYAFFVDNASERLSGWGDVQPDDQPGQANLSNLGGLNAALFISPDERSPSQGQVVASFLLHEITHNMGAVQLGAPNSSGDYHCNDGQDIMCYADKGSRSNYNDSVCPEGSGLLPEAYDCNQDDYFSPSPAPGSWLALNWNTYNSAFMADCSEPPARCQAPLTAFGESTSYWIRKLSKGQRRGGLVGQLQLEATRAQDDPAITLSASVQRLRLRPGTWRLSTCIELSGNPQGPALGRNCLRKRWKLARSKALVPPVLSWKLAGAGGARYARASFLLQGPKVRARSAPAPSDPAQLALP